MPSPALVLAVLAAFGAAAPDGGAPDVRPRWRITCADGRCELWLFGARGNRAWAVPRGALEGAGELAPVDGRVLMSIEPCAASGRRVALVFDPRAETFAPAGAAQGAPAAQAEPEGCLGALAGPAVEPYQGWLELGHVYDLEVDLEGPRSVWLDPPVKVAYHYGWIVSLVNRDDFPALAGAEAGRFALRVEMVGLEIRQQEEWPWTSRYLLRVLECRSVASPTLTPPPAPGRPAAPSARW